MFDDHSPIYLQIAAQIEEQILGGDLEGDDQVMSTNAYASYFRINPATAAKGINLLVDEGILYKRRGLGMFVSPDAAVVLRRRRREGFFTDRVAAVIAEARLLEIPLDEVAQHIASSDGPPTGPPTPDHSKETSV